MASLAARGVIDATDKSPLINILAIVMLIVAALAVATRLSTKYFVSHMLGWDDLAISCALIIHAGQVAAVFIAASSGLGRHFDGLSPEQIKTFEKALYASQLLLIWALAISKISVPVFFYQVTPGVSHQRAAIGVGVAIIIWALAYFVAAAVQCTPPAVWQISSPHCFRQREFWISFDALNAATEVAIIILATVVVWEVQAKMDQKFTIVCCFATRVCVLAAAVCQAVFTKSPQSTQSDPSFARWEVVLCSIFAASSSIITACVPYIKGFYVNLESGMIRTDDVRRRQTSTSTFKSISRLAERRPSQFTPLTERQPSDLTSPSRQHITSRSYTTLRLGSADSGKTSNSQLASFSRPTRIDVDIPE